MQYEVYLGIYKSCAVSAPKRYIFVQKFLPFLEKMLCKENEILYLLGADTDTAYIELSPSYAKYTSISLGNSE